ncbi:hypothetical protein INR49_027718 [Caranx melampygus]|nr:hypothetical protein INR49_027718 [Caranx melampygus]
MPNQAANSHSSAYCPGGGTMEDRSDVGCSLLRGLSSPLDVGDLQYWHEQLERILDVCPVYMLS